MEVSAKMRIFGKSKPSIDGGKIMLRGMQGMLRPCRNG